MESSLVTELRSLTIAALTATSAAERANWQEAARCASDIRDRAHRVFSHLSCIESELGGRGEPRSLELKSKGGVVDPLIES
jgi:hypothetical protein